MSAPIQPDMIDRIMHAPAKRAGLLAQHVELRALAPIRARCDQADMADTPLFGTRSLL